MAPLVDGLISQALRYGAPSGLITIRLNGLKEKQAIQKGKLGLEGPPGKDFANRFMLPLDC